MNRTDEELMAEVAARVALENPDDEDLATTAIYLEKAAKRHGGARDGAGRPDEGKKRLVLYPTPEEREAIFQAVPRLRPKK